MKKLIALLGLFTSCWAACPPDARGVCVTGLTALQDWLLGPLTPEGTNPWIFGDLGEEGTYLNTAPAAIADIPTLGTACTGTASFTSGDDHMTTTADMSACTSGQTYMIFAWSSVDGAGTGRLLCAVSSTTSTTIFCGGEHFSQPTFSGVTVYRITPGTCILCWLSTQPSASWNYYDNSIFLYRLYYRTLNATYQTWARTYADTQWQWVLDHGYRTVYPRASSLIGQFFRALDGHPERLPGLYQYLTILNPNWGNPAGVPYVDNREVSYYTWGVAMGAAVDSDPTRHSQYCSWLTAEATSWVAVQSTDGSWGEYEFAINRSYVSAPKIYTFQLNMGGVLALSAGGAPWREAINLKGLEASYIPLADTNTTTGCNQPALAAQVLNAITLGVQWQWNYGRDTTTRGVYYTVNSQSNEQTYIAISGTIATISGTAVTGSGTNWQSQGLCDGTHYMGFNTIGGVYRVASCSSNTALTLGVAYGFYGEAPNADVGSAVGGAPGASTTCHSLATYCIDGNSDRNLVRTMAGDTAWLYNQTGTSTYLTWTDEYLSSVMGGPTAGLNVSANVGFVTLPCTGPACDGLVEDWVATARTCGLVPCIFSTYLNTFLGKNLGEYGGAPGIDNALAWRLPPLQGTIGTKISNVKVSSGVRIQ